MGLTSFAVAASIAATATVGAQPVPDGNLRAVAVAPTSIQAPPIVPAGTPVRLMILREITSRTARNGDRFKLRVDEPVYINGVLVIPVGATAWGEISAVEKNGAVGKGGRLGARLLYLDLPSGRIPLRGDYADRGEGNGAGVVLAVVGFGLLGLLNGGDSARLKAGDSFTGYVEAASPSQNAALVTPPASGAVMQPDRTTTQDEPGKPTKYH